MRIPLKYKFLSVLICTMALGFSIFYYFVQKTFSNDKKLFVMDLNLTLLKAAISEVKLELKGRMEELQLLVPKIYTATANSKDDPFQGLPPRMSDEVLAVRFYRKSAQSSEYSQVKKYFNSALLEKKGLTVPVFETLNSVMPVSFSALAIAEGMQILNRSYAFTVGDKKIPLPVLTLVFTGTLSNSDSGETVICVDLEQHFLQQKLQQSELAEIFLIAKSGNILSHANIEPMVDFASKPFNHPIVERLQNKLFPRESLELTVDKEDYLCNLSETGFNDIFAISQIKKKEAFSALYVLLKQMLQIMGLIFSVAVVFSIVFAAGLTANIQKLMDAAQKIGSGELKLSLNIRSGDEVQKLAESFQWMTQRLIELIAESATKARMEEELETAKLVQSTLLTPPQITTDAAEIVPFYKAASECGGDFWDAFVHGNKLTVVLGDATGHGAPAAIVTAVAKSCIATMNTVFSKFDISPHTFLWMLNNIIFNSCKGKLLMTMSIIQIDIDTGKMTHANAGHESPLILPFSGAKADTKIKCDTLFARGERLGFAPDAKYDLIDHQLSPEDTVFQYTDGISEAPDTQGKMFGERALKKVLANGGKRPLAQIRDEIMAKVESHTTGTPQHDDITFVLVSWKQAQLMKKSKAA